MERRRYRSEVEDSARWDGFAFREGDIVISSPSKCGTTWTQMICALLVFQTPELPAPLTTLSPWLDMRVRPVAEVHALLDAQQHRRFIKTHSPLDGVPHDPRVTYIAVCRDPRDVIVSLLHQGDNLRYEHIEQLVRAAEPDGPAWERPPGTGRPLTVRERILRWVDDDIDPAESLDTLRGIVWQTSVAWERRREHAVVLLHYSDLSRDLDAEMRRLAARLRIDVDPATWPALVEAARFASMKDRAADLVPDERLGLMKDRDRFFRSGGSGEWREHVTPADIAHYEARIAALAPPDLAAWMHHGAEATTVTLGAEDDD